MTYIVALIGGIGSGKTTISNLFKSIGIKVIDADTITRNILKHDQNIIHKILEKFGIKILNTHQLIDRKRLKTDIFSNKAKKIWLENLLHPIIIEIMKKQLKIIEDPWCLWVVPLLIETNLCKYANRILLVDVPVKTQIARTIQRDNINIIQVKSIISSQATRLERLLIADDIINNTKKISTIKKNIQKLNKYYLKLSNNLI
ncbi:MAG: dephospho-CoA kinase [Buchnera aphidicola (Schlechtendalia peitan)]